MPGPVVVRRAAPGDAGDLLALRRQWQPGPPDDDLAARFTAWFAQEWPTRWWWLAQDAGRPVGMVNLKLFDRMPSAARGPSRWGYLANLRSGFTADSGLLAWHPDRP